MSLTQSFITNIAPLTGKLFDSARHELAATGVFFPGRPAIRCVQETTLRSEPACNKNAKQAGRLGAGTLLFWCAEHRHCLGFSVLQSAESTQHIYTIMATRFKQMPKVIIYDNGCNLHEYFLNRSPWLVKDCMILSDGFHWCNHTTCSDSYNSKEYLFLNSNFWN